MVSENGAEPFNAEPWVPDSRSLKDLEEAAATCRGCPLWRDATQTVFGSGRPKAEILMVGEQPGDREDRQGEPFVGPAGQLLDQAMEEAGIDRKAVYITNAVKHFKWMPRGKRRIHRKPSVEEVAACRPWLDAEIAAVKPRVIVCLGATAAQGMLGSSFRVTRQRGEFMPWPGIEGTTITATIHPSAILRADEDVKEAEMKALIADLAKVKSFLNQ